MNTVITVYMYVKNSAGQLVRPREHKHKKAYKTYDYLISFVNNCAWGLKLPYFNTTKKVASIHRLNISSLDGTLI